MIMGHLGHIFCSLWISSVKQDSWELLEQIIKILKGNVEIKQFMLQMLKPHK